MNLVAYGSINLLTKPNSFVIIRLVQVNNFVTSLIKAGGLS